MSEANNNTEAKEESVAIFDDAQKVETPETVVETTKEVEAKTEEKAVETPAEEKKDETPNGELDLKVPDGSSLKPEDVEKIKQFAKENGLSQEAAQKILTDKAETIANIKKAQDEELQQKRVAWLNESKADKEIGGEAFNEHVELANRALNEFAPQEFRKVLDDSGLGNNALVIKTFARIAKRFSNDKLVAAPKSQAAKTVADYDLFYSDPK